MLGVPVVDVFPDARLRARRCGAGGRGPRPTGPSRPRRWATVRSRPSSKRCSMGSERALLVAAGGGIGDTLLAGVVARALRTRYAAVDAVVLPAHLELAAPPARRRGGDAARRAADRALRRRGRHLGHRAHRAAALAGAHPAPGRPGPPAVLRACSPTASWCAASWATARTHWTQILLDYARALDCDVADATPGFALRDDERQAAATLLRVHDVSGPYYLLHPTRGLSAQRARWPTAGFAALAARLVARDGVPVLVSGAPADARAGRDDRRGRRARRDQRRRRDLDRHVRRAGRRRAGGGRDGLRADARRRGGRRADGRHLRAAVGRARPLGAAGPAHRGGAADLPLPARAPQGDLSRLRLRARARRGARPGRARRTARRRPPNAER